MRIEIGLMPMPFPWGSICLMRDSGETAWKAVVPAVSSCVRGGSRLHIVWSISITTI